MHLLYQTIFIIKFCVLAQTTLCMQYEKPIMPEPETKELINEINSYKSGRYYTLSTATSQFIKQNLSIYRIEETTAATIDSNSRYTAALCSDYETFKLLSQNNIISPYSTIYVGSQKKTPLTDLSLTAPFYISQTGNIAIKNPRLFFSLDSPNENIRKILFWITTYPQFLNKSLYLDEDEGVTFLGWALNERQLVITHLLVRNGAYKLNGATERYDYQPLLEKIQILEQDKRSCGIKTDYELDRLRNYIDRHQAFQKNRHIGAYTLCKKFGLLSDLHKIIDAYGQPELDF